MIEGLTGLTLSSSSSFPIRMAVRKYANNLMDAQMAQDGHLEKDNIVLLTPDIEKLIYSTPIEMSYGFASKEDTHTSEIGDGD